LQAGTQLDTSDNEGSGRAASKIKNKGKQYEQKEKVLRLLF
jgi:hypothetical protein